MKVGDLFGRYRIKASLGRGGMGAIYKGYDPVLRRHVALKVLLRERARESIDELRRDRARMLREARAAAAFSHPNAVSIFDVGEVDDTPFLAMELLDGEPLRAYVGDQAVPVETRVAWLTQVARALAAAHARGLVHRDVKPENVMVCADGTTKVLDFGIAVRSGDAATLDGPPSTQLNEPGQAWGTPRYMAPEQILGTETDGRTDQFAWGIVAYELLTGRHPWPTAPGLVANAILNEPAPPWPAEVPVPEGVARTIGRALAKRADDRFATMTEIVQVLEGSSGSGRTTALVRPSRAPPEGLSARAAETAPDSEEPTESEVEGGTARSSPTEGATPPNELSAGDVLGGRYEILRELGRGAQGAVFAARDRRANTDVALKLLHGDEDSVRRFRRELLAARKVTHFGVVRVYDLIDAEGHLALTMELVEGETLAARLERGPSFTFAEVRALAIDLARALEAAHAAGVVHRDLKPANILLRAGTGRPVVTDFGVSRLHGERAPSSVPAVRGGQGPSAAAAEAHTLEGAIVGTPRYMAPEQLEGRAGVGPPADVFAFGIVVLEVATGKAPEVRSAGDAAARAARDALARAHPETPPSFSEVLGRCLLADPAARFADGAALLAALEATTRRRPARPIALGVGVLAAVASGAIAVVFARGTPSPKAASAASASSAAGASPTPFRPSHVRRITFGEGCEEFPSFTPDGQSVVYDGIVGPDDFLFSLSLSDGHPKQLTHDKGWDFAPAVSPDGHRVAFLSTHPTAGLYAADLDGSGRQKLAGPGSVRPSWATDGRSIWTGRSHAARVAALDGSVLEELPVVSGYDVDRVVELADGRRAELVVLARSGASARIGVVDHGSFRMVSEGAFDSVLLAGADGRSLYGSRLTPPSAAELVRFSVDGSGESSPVSGMSPRLGLSRSPMGRRLVWSDCRELPGIARVERGSLVPVDIGAPGQVEGVAPIPGSHDVVVMCDRNGSMQPWIVDVQGSGDPRLVPTGAEGLSDAAVSADGRWLSFSVQDKGIGVVPLAGGAPLRMVTNGALDRYPAFRGPANEILFTRFDSSGRPEVYSVPFEGGAPRALLEPGTKLSAVSPTPGVLAYLAVDAASVEGQVMLVDAKGKRPLSSQLPRAEGRYAWVAFSPDGHKVAVAGIREVLEVDLASDTVTRRLEGGADMLTRVTYVGEALVVERTRWSGNLWTADGEL